jgi:hypothetical protein
VALGDNGKVLLKKKFTQKRLISSTCKLSIACVTGSWREELL